MSGFNLQVVFKGMVAFVPNDRYNEMIALVVDTEAGRHPRHDRGEHAGHGEGRGEPGPLLPNHLPHHPRLVFNCLNVVGCPENQVQGLNPYRDVNGDLLSEKVAWNLAGHDLSLQLDEKNELPLNSLAFERIREEQLPQDEPGRRPNDSDMRRLIDLSHLARSTAGRDAGEVGEVEPGLVTKHIGANLENLVVARVLLTAGKVRVNDFDTHGLWSFRASEESDPVFSQWMPIEVIAEIPVDSESVTLVASSYRGGGTKSFELKPFGDMTSVEIWVQNEPTKKNWQAYEDSFAKGHPIPRDEHFKMYYQLCANPSQFDFSKLPVPHRPSKPFEYPAGNEPIICPKPTLAASANVGR